MAAPVRNTITYGLDADAYRVARAVDAALQGHGYHVSVETTGGEDEVWFVRRGAPATEAVQFEPGQQLTVTYDGVWRIEDAPGAEAAA